MEPSQFDELTKAMATPKSRRKALKSMLGGTFVGLLTLGGLGTVFAQKKCPPGLTNCHGICVDTKKDPNNCGHCDDVCASGICNNGVCCPPGAQVCSTPTGDQCCSFTCCGGVHEQKCVNTETDVNNCGGCGNVCLPGEVCKNGTCVCPSGVICNGVCCKAKGSTCVGGVCVAPKCPDNNCTGCAPFFTPPCIDFTCFCYQTTDANCGCGANILCAGAQHCSSCGDCPPGDFCAINTGCGAAGICIPSCLPGGKPKNLKGRTSAIIKH